VGEDVQAGEAGMHDDKPCRLGVKRRWVLASELQIPEAMEGSQEDICSPVEESSDPPAGGERCKPWVCREQSVERSEAYVLIGWWGWWLEGLQLCSVWLMVWAGKRRHDAAL